MKPKPLTAITLVLSNLLAVSPAAPQNDSGPFNMGPVINTTARDAAPTFTPSGQTMYFNCFDRHANVGGDICVTHREGDSWTAPKIVETVSTDEYLEVEPLLSPDGQELYIMSNRPGGLGSTDIWVSDLIDDEWTEPRNLGAPFNSADSDHCLYFGGENWDFAYWTSTRPGGFGGNDIWKSQRVNGVWQGAVNLGSKVNSAASEHHSLPSEDGKSLYITATRAEGFGLEDIYVTTQDNKGNWSDLVNLGPKVNSERHDRCPAFSPDFEYFFFDSERAGGFGNKDLWYVPYSQIESIR